jgi:SAM-dependent methyltransferase
MDEYSQTNLARWDELVGVHLGAREFYDVDAFKAGRSTLKAIEREEVGDVHGKRLLHLQCHFGMDTISWAREGAVAVGVDFSPEAIRVARELSAELEAGAEFVCSDVYELPGKLEGAFDIVFASYGIICWLPDLAAWGKIISHFLVSGGFFYIVDVHPMGDILDERDGELTVGLSYFDPGPIEEVVEEGSYADRTAVVEHKTSYQWQHPLSEIVNAFVDAGFQVEFLHEFPFCMFQRLPSMVRGEDGWWRVPGHDDVPYLFSLRASKP